MESQFLRFGYLPLKGHCHSGRTWKNQADFFKFVSRAPGGITMIELTYFLGLKIYTFGIFSGSRDDLPHIFLVKKYTYFLGLHISEQCLSLSLVFHSCIFSVRLIYFLGSQYLAISPPPLPCHVFCEYFLGSWSLTKSGKKVYSLWESTSKSGKKVYFLWENTSRPVQLGGNVYSLKRPLGWGKEFINNYCRDQD